ncbi:MAG: response regulator [bacterium]|nr:response regulator [bacterium]
MSWSQRLWVLILGVLCLTSNVHSQIGTPHFKYFSPQDYKEGNRNWAIASDAKGVIYVGNDDGILRFDGISWELIPLPQNQIAYWLEKGEDGNIYVGANGEIGMLISDLNGKVSYKSFLPFIPEPYLDFNVVWEIGVDQNGVLFRSKKYSYFHPYGSDKVVPLVAPKGGRSFDCAFAARDTVYSRVYGLGLHYLNENGVHLLPNSEFFAERKVNGIYAYGDDELLVATRFEGLFIYNKETGVRRFNTTCDQYLIDYKIYDGQLLSDGNYAISTMGNGIVVIDPSGQEVFRFDSSNGLGKHRPLFIIEIEDQLWVGMKNGIYVLSYNSPYRFIKQEYGITGQIKDILRHKDDLYVTCNDGLYKLNDRNLPKFEPLNQDLIVDCIDLFEINDKLWVTSLEGVHQYDDNTGSIKKLFKLISRELVQTEYKNIVVSAGFYFGASIIFLGDEPVNFEIENIERGVTQVIKKSPLNYLFKTEANQLFDVVIEPAKKSAYIKNQFQLPENGHLVQFGNSTYVVTSEEVFDLTDDGVEKSNQKLGFSFKAKEIVLVEKQKDETCFVCYKDELSNYYCDLTKLADGKLVTTGSYFYSEFKPEVIYNDDESIFLGGITGIKVIDQHNQSNKGSANEKVFIRKVKASGTAVIYSPDQNQVVQLGSKLDNIEFDFSSNGALSDKAYYQYRLMGLSDAWSEWNERKTTNYSGLPPGYYTFQVRGVSLNGSYSDIANFSFVVATPWYVSWYAYLIYVAVFALVVYVVYQRRIRFLKWKQQQLQELIDDQTKELSHANEQLEEKAQKLEQLDNFKSRFFANISHDLRTPITLLSGRIKQIKEDENSFYSSSTEKYLGSMDKVSQKLVSMVNDISELVAMEEGNLKLEKHPVQLSGYIALVSGLFQSAADIRNIELSVKSTISGDFKVMLDTEKFDRVMFNLISNALKFTNAQGKILIEVLEKNGAAHIKVSDDGIGIPSNHISNIFDRNFQASNNSKAKEGMGIGLSVAKEIVELHGGQITVQSIPDKGATFDIVLPKHIETNGQSFKELSPSEFIIDREKQFRDELIAIEKVPSNVTLDLGDKSLKKILLVEDHPEVREYMVELLAPTYEVITASNGAQALSKMEKLDVDLVITDLMMPVMDGFEFIDGIKQSSSYQNIPIMVVSARSSRDDKFKVLSKGVTEILSKPFDKDELILRINQLITSQPVDDGLKNAVNNHESYENLQLQKLNNIILSEIENSNVTALLIADQLNTTERSLYRLVKKITGKTPNEYVKDIKFQFAYDLIQAKKVNSVKQAASKIGMSNSTNFNKQFLKRFGKRAEELF